MATAQPPEITRVTAHYGCPVADSSVWGYWATCNPGCPGPFGRFFWAAASPSQGCECTCVGYVGRCAFGLGRWSAVGVTGAAAPVRFGRGYSPVMSRHRDHDEDGGHQERGGADRQRPHGPPGGGGVPPARSRVPPTGKATRPHDRRAAARGALRRRGHPGRPRTMFTPWPGLGPFEMPASGCR